MQAAQRREIERLADDRDYAEQAGRTEFYARVGEWLTPPGRVLEVGAGPGRFVALLATLGHAVVGVDPFDFPEWRELRTHERIELVSGIRAESLPFPDESFDHVACLGALLYFNDPDVALAEMRRVIKPGGRLVVRTVNSGNLYTRRTGRRLDPASKFLFTRDELVDVVSRAGFRVEQSFAFGFWPPFATDLWWWLQTAVLPESAVHRLGRALPEGRRVNVVVHAVAA